MNGTTKSRLMALETLCRASQGKLFTVYYRDGRTRREAPGNCIDLALREPELIERFEEGKNCGNNGIMEDLLNALLIDTSEGSEVDEQETLDG